MNGTLAQLISLTTHANAYLKGHTIRRALVQQQQQQSRWPYNYCEFVKFFDTTNEAVADDPNQWFSYLKRENVVGVRVNFLRRSPTSTAVNGEEETKNRATLTDRQSAGFIGGGGDWF